MNIVNVKGDFNDRYINSVTCIDLSIKRTFLNVEESAWIIRATCILSSEPLGSSDTLFNRWTYIIIFQERDRFLVHPNYIISLSHNRRFCLLIRIMDLGLVLHHWVYY